MYSSKNNLPESQPVPSQTWKHLVKTEEMHLSELQLQVLETVLMFLCAHEACQARFEQERMMS